MTAMSRHWPTASGSVQDICPGCSRDTWAPARCKSLKPPASSGPSGFSTRPTLRCRRLPCTLASAACVDSTRCLRKYIDVRQPRSGALAIQVVRNVGSLATHDHTVHPDLQRWVSKRMGATVTEVTSSHLPMLSQPDVVIGVIRKAAAAVQNG